MSKSAAAAGIPVLFGLFPRLRSTQECQSGKMLLEFSWVDQRALSETSKCWIDKSAPLEAAILEQMRLFWALVLSAPSITHSLQESLQQPFPNHPNARIPFLCRPALLLQALVLINCALNVQKLL